jgi:glycosyltransferase involved in cell wall biosynthesis
MLKRDNLDHRPTEQLSSRSTCDSLTDCRDRSLGEAPLVSIMIVTYNQERWVEEAIHSAISQDYPNLEVIVADDGSSDGTKSIIQRIAAKNPRRIVPILGSTNVGVTPNCNRGLRACRGRYIAFGAGDDILLPGKITAQVAWLEADAGRVLCGHDVEMIAEDGKFMDYYSSHYRLRSGRGAGAVIRSGTPFPATSAMIRRQALPSAGFDERIMIVSDRKLWIDCLAEGGEYGTIPGVYSRYRVYEGSLSQRVARDPQVELIAFEDMLLILSSVEVRHPTYASAVRRVRSEIYADRSWQALRRGQFPEARQHARRALRESLRGSWLAWLSLALAHAPRWFVRDVRRPGSWLYRHSRYVRHRLG